jgi:bacillithiol biosynthesis cysteine-adding enzyme BshC
VRVHSEAPARSATSSRFPVDIRRFPWVRRLATDYAYNFPRLAPFFAGSPTDRGAWTDAIARVGRHEHDRGGISGVLAAQQERRGSPTAARAAAARLSDTRAVAILTGQQAGLFGGPLYTLLKALSALKLAARVEQEHDVPAVAVFWVDGEDHDWDEVRSCPVLDEHLELRVASLARRDGSELPVAGTRLDGSITRAFDELAAALAPTEFRDDLLARLRASYAPNLGMADAFCRWLEAVLGDRGLIVFDAADPAAKPLASRIFSHELAHPGDTARLASRAGAELSAAGYHAQVDTQTDQAALFRFGDDGGRHAVRLRDGGFAAGGQPFDRTAILEEARSRPQRFSPGVLLRPLVEDTLFPTICYVAGPSELAYHAQLGNVYDAFGVARPLVHARLSATVADSAAFRFLAKYNVPFESLQPQDEAALNALLAEQIPPAVEQAFTAADAGLAAAVGTIASELATIDPTLKGAADSTLSRMQHDLQTLHGKMIAAAKRRDDTLRRQFSRTQALAFPSGRPQERSVAFVWALNQYGPALVARLDEELLLDQGVHWVVTV